MSYDAKIKDLKSINIFGVTGSIGCSTITVLNSLSNRNHLRINALSAHDNVMALAKYSIEQKASYAVITNPNKYSELKDALFGTSTIPLAGSDTLIAIAEQAVDWTMNAIVGFSGLEPSLAVAKTGKFLALANKESLVVAGMFS